MYLATEVEDGPADPKPALPPVKEWSQNLITK